MKIGICDDDKIIHEDLKKLIYNSLLYRPDYTVMDFYDAESLLEGCEQESGYDIIFLDIEMDKISGMEAAKKIKQLYKNTIIIFISNYPSYVFEAFRVEALHFIVKPVSEAEFADVFSRAINKYSLLNSALNLKWQNERYVIKIDTIMYIEGYKRHITVHTTDGIFEALGKIPEVLKELSAHGFIRTHQGFIVNMAYIKRFETTDVVLFDDTKVMISVRKRPEALSLFDNYLRHRKW